MSEKTLYGEDRLDALHEMGPVRVEPAGCCPHHWYFLNYPNWPEGRERWLIEGDDLGNYWMRAPRDGIRTLDHCLRLIPKEAEAAKEAILQLRIQDRSTRA